MPRRHFFTHRRRQRGSVLIVALILSAIIALSLGSYIRLALTSLTLADRSFYQNAAVNLTEVGIEEAMYCYNQLDDVSAPADAWGTGWNIDSSNGSVRRIFSSISLGPGVSGQVRVYCSLHNPGTSSTPVVMAKATVTFERGGAPINKYMEVTLRKRSLFVNGLVAKDGITWVGHPTADSWRSDHDNRASTAAVPYDVSIRTANCTVGAATGNISLGSGGNVYGYAKAGATGTISGGSVHGLGTTTNDPSRISNDFSANFPAIVTPTPTTINVVASGSVPTEFPLATHAVNIADGKYYYNFGPGANIKDTTTIGDTVPNKNVVLIMNNLPAGGPAFSLSGAEKLTVKNGSTLTLYTTGDINVTGNAMLNGTTAGGNPPSSLIIYGTAIAPTVQEIKVGGNGQLYAAIYAPNANVEMKGGGASGMVLGSVVAKSITMNGGTDFHYDESLANLGTGNPFGIVKWRELQSKEDRDLAEPNFP